MSTTNYYKACIKTLQVLHKQHPTFPIGRHISTALDGYGDAWGMTDKEMYYALKRYQTILETDQEARTEVHERYVERVVDRGMHLDELFTQDTSEQDQGEEEENNW